MPKRIRLDARQTDVALARRYHTAREPILRSHLLINWLVRESALRRPVAEFTGCSADGTRELSALGWGEDSAALPDPALLRSGEGSPMYPLGRTERRSNRRSAW